MQAGGMPGSSMSQATGSTRQYSIGSIAAIAERGSSDGQINWSQSTQPQAQATDQEKAAAAKQAEKKNAACALTC